MPHDVDGKARASRAGAAALLALKATGAVSVPPCLHTGPSKSPCALYTSSSTTRQPADRHMTMVDVPDAPTSWSEVR